MEELEKPISSIYNILKKNNKIIIPNKETIKNWDQILQNWIDNTQMVLFARKSGMPRGTKIKIDTRTIMITDNTPAHWVFKTIVIDKDKKMLNIKNIRDLILSNQFPISFIRKKNESETLSDGMIANGAVFNTGWKLTHIHPIALKRGSNLRQCDYNFHHFKFLSLDNMYLIDKTFSGLAEVSIFNKIVSIDKEK